MPILMDCSEGRQIWRVRPSSASFRLHSFLPSSSPLILLFLILRHPSYSFLECRRRGATGRLGRRFGSVGGATAPGTALGPRGCRPRGRPGLSSAPTCPNLRRAIGEARSGEARLKEQVFAAVAEADEGRERGEEGDPLMEQAFGRPPCSRRGRLAELFGVCRGQGFGPNRALPGASGELRCSPGLVGFQP